MAEGSGANENRAEAAVIECAVSRPARVNMRAEPMALYWAAIVCFTLLVVVRLEEQYFPITWKSWLSSISFPTKIHWVKVEDAREACLRTKKSVLLVNCSRTNFGLDQSIFEFRKHAFLYDDSIADYINQHFIPVRYDGDAGDLEARFELIGRGCLSWPGYSSLFTVLPFDVVSGQNDHIEGTGNLAEDGCVHCEGAPEPGDTNVFVSDKLCSSNARVVLPFLRPPKIARSLMYLPRSEQMLLLREAALWHKLKPTRGLIAWRPQNELDAPIKKDRPRIIFLLRPGCSCDEMRTSLFHDSRIYNRVNREFEPFLVEKSNDPLANNKFFKDVYQRYHIRSEDDLPVIIVKNSRGLVETHYGAENLSNVLAFLDWFKSLEMKGAFKVSKPCMTKNVHRVFGGY